MSKTRRVWNIILAVLNIQGALILMLVPDIAFLLIAIFVGFMLMGRGLKYLFYYMTQANHMVGGKRVLLVGLFLFDFGVFVTMLVDEPQAIMIVYVVAIHLVAAVINIIRTVGNKKDGNPGWKIDFAQFFGNLAQVVLCLVFIGHVEIPVYIYCIGEIYGSILKIISSCKKTAIVYVQ